MGNSIQSISKQLRSLVWHRHWKNIQVVNPAAHMGIGAANFLSAEEADAQLGDLLKRWGQDPVHPASEAYRQLAETLLSKMVERSKAHAETPAGTRKRKRSPSGDRRPSGFRCWLTARASPW